MVSFGLCVSTSEASAFALAFFLFLLLSSSRHTSYETESHARCCVVVILQNTPL